MVRRKKEISIYSLFSLPGFQGFPGFKGALGQLIDPRRDPLRRLEAAIGYQFKDESLLYLALTHRSFPPILEKKLGLKISHNESLEFLGDAVLSLALASAILRKKDCRSEREASSARSAIASNENLLVRARRLGLGPLLYLAPGQKDNEKALPDALEALIGAVFIDGGLKRAKGVVGKIFHQDLALPYERLRRKNYRAYLRAALPGVSLSPRERGGPEPKGDDRKSGAKEEGAGRHRAFVYTAEGRLLARGEGQTRKSAETRAAKKALLALGLITPEML